MFNRISEDRLNPGPLPERLRALPAFAPPPGGWAGMNARLVARRRNYAVAGGGLALAASVLVGIGLVGLRPESASVPAERSNVAAAAPAAARISPAVAQLISRSQALERELSAVRTQAVVWDTGRDTRAGLLEQELRRVDAQINFADAASAEQLWRYRVKLMNALVDLHEPEAPALQYASYQY